MKGIGRNLRFWGVQLHKVMFIQVSTIAVMLLFFAFMEGEDFKEGTGGMIPFFLVMLTVVVAFINALNGITIQFPMTVSLGSTRKDSFIGMQLVHHLIMLEFLTAIYAWFYFVVFQRENPFGKLYLMTAVGLVLLMLGLCQLTAAANVRFGRVIGMIVYFVCVISLVAFVVTFVLAGKRELISLDFLQADFLEKPWILLVGVVFDSAMILVLYNQVRKRDLRFG